MNGRLADIKRNLVPHSWIPSGSATWLVAELEKYMAWHAHNLELISEQAAIIQEANAKLAEMSREVGKQAELLRSAGAIISKLDQQNHGPE